MIFKTIGVHLNCLLNLFVVLIVYLNIDVISCQRVKLSDVETLTLTKGVYTTGRRLPGVPQLKCLGGSAGCKYSPSNVQCYNRGSNGIDVEWECKAELDTTIKFGILRVTCEGYDYDTDAYVLAGSCGLEYTIDYRSSTDYYDIYRRRYLENNKLGNFLTILVMIVIILSIYKSCSKFHDNAYDPYSSGITPSNNLDNNTLGYDYSQFPAPPPPYGFVNNNNNNNTTPRQTQSTPESQLPQPNESTFNENIPTRNTLNGFLSGAAVGGLAGYMFGRSMSSDSSRNRNGYESPPPAYEPDDDNTKTSTGFASTTRR